MSPKLKTVYSCQNCGSQYPKWQGQCGGCGEWNTLVEEIADSGKKTNGKPRGKLIKLSDVTKKQLQRISTGVGEFDRVLGGGIVAGEIALVAGAPGIGKSTLLTQLSLNFKSVVYVCGEESPSQVRIRVERLGKEGKGLQLLPETDVDVVVATLSSLKPDLVIVDSIQTLTTEDLSGMAGSVGQIRECTSRLISYSKNTDVPVMLVGHVTKEGEIAGPKILEHMVDCVLDLSGDRYHELRLLRAVKNRFGATDEVGVFRMSTAGMEEVSNPSEIFLDERDESASGSSVAVIMEGTRPVLVEVQALVSKTELPIPRRVAQGIDVRRLQILTGVLQKHTGILLGNRDVFVKVTGGLILKEPAVDLAVAMAIASSHSGKPLPKKAVSIGEVGLLGEIRSVSWYEKRVKEAKKLGFTTIYSRSKWKKLKDLVKLVSK